MRSIPNLFVAPTSELADEFARRVAERARDAVHERGQFSLALSGGSIAPALLPTLGDAPLPWESVSLFWIDERAVPPDDPQSNFGEAMELLAGSAAARQARIHPMEVHDDLDASARAYSDRLVEVLGTPPSIDVVMLGVGDDGHVASLFPGHEQAAGEWVVAEYHSPKPTTQRLTLTYETLAVAGVTCIVVLGTSKAEAVRSILMDPSSELPAARVARTARELWILADPDAASLVPHGGGH